MATLGNIIWFILGGWIHLIVTLLLALVFAITIIGLPIARALLEYVKICAFPFGKAIISVSDLKGKENVSGFSKVIHIILNILWFPFGLGGAIVCFFVGIFFFCTIIFIPFGIAYFRIGKYIFLPFGKRVVTKDKVEAIALSNELNRVKYGQQSKNKKCRQCNEVYPINNNACPKCGSSLYEEVNIGNVVSNPVPINAPVTGDSWTCKKCNEKNLLTAASCKSCGEYR